MLFLSLICSLPASALPRHRKEPSGSQIARLDAQDAVWAGSETAGPEQSVLHLQSFEPHTVIVPTLFCIAMISHPDNPIKLGMFAPVFFM